MYKYKIDQSGLALFCIRQDRIVGWWSTKDLQLITSIDDLLSQYSFTESGLDGAEAVMIGRDEMIDLGILKV